MLETIPAVIRQEACLRSAQQPITVQTHTHTHTVHLHSHATLSQPNGHVFGEEHADPSCLEAAGLFGHVITLQGHPRARTQGCFHCQFSHKNEIYTEESKGCSTSFYKTNRKMKVVDAIVL